MKDPACTSTLPIGTEIRRSEIGYYDYWYPSNTGTILKEEVEARAASYSEFRYSLCSDWTPFVVSEEVATALGFAIKIVWVKNNKRSDQ